MGDESQLRGLQGPMLQLPAQSSSPTCVHPPSHFLSSWATWSPLFQVYVPRSLWLSYCLLGPGWELSSQLLGHGPDTPPHWVQPLLPNHTFLLPHDGCAVCRLQKKPHGGLAGPT